MIAKGWIPRVGGEGRQIDAVQSRVYREHHRPPSRRSSRRQTRAPASGDVSRAKRAGRVVVRTTCIAMLRADRDDTASRRRQLATRIRRRQLPVDREAADEVRRAGCASVTETLLLDNSAGARLADPNLSDDRVNEIADAFEAGRIATCLPFLLEAGYSARTAREHDELLAELQALPRFQIDAEVERRAVDAPRQLARAGHHRLPPVDVLVAAIADRLRLGILHYDRDYDLLAEKTDLNIASVWLAPAGSL
jgi:predicted nucleic acid-binding protein